MLFEFCRTREALLFKTPFIHSIHWQLLQPLFHSRIMMVIFRNRLILSVLSKLHHTRARTGFGSFGKARKLIMPCSRALKVLEKGSFQYGYGKVLSIFVWENSKIP